MHSISETYEGKVIKVDRLLSEQTELKADIKAKANALHLETKTTIEGLTGRESRRDTVHLKWIAPLSRELASMPSNVITQLTTKVQALSR